MTLIDLSADALAEHVATEGIEPNPIIMELTRTLLDLTEREKRARLALIQIQNIQAKSNAKPYTALEQIAEIARRALA